MDKTKAVEIETKDKEPGQVFKIQKKRDNLFGDFGGIAELDFVDGLVKVKHENK